MTQESRNEAIDQQGYNPLVIEPKWQHYLG